MARVQRKCGRDGRKLVDGLYILAFGTAAQQREFFGEDVAVETRDRRAAMEALLDRGWGKPYAPRDESDLPLVVDGPPQVVINLPRPHRELEHHRNLRNQNIVIIDPADVEPRRG
jgi:hypothetical protein